MGLLNVAMPWKQIVAMGIGCAALCLLGFSAASEGVRYHGIQLDDQHHLVIEQREGGFMRIGVRARTRTEGGLEPENVQLEEGKPETGRLEQVEFIVEVRSQIMKPAAPNYFQSHGQTYLITVESLMKEVPYYSAHVVSARDARTELAVELQILRANTDGIRQLALFWATPIVLAEYKNVGLMPAPVFKTVEASTGGSLRTKPDSLERRSLPGGRQIGPTAGFTNRQPLTGMARAKAMATERRAGGPTERAGAGSYRPDVVRSGNIKPDYRPGGMRVEEPVSGKERTGGHTAFASGGNPE